MRAFPRFLPWLALGLAAVRPVPAGDRFTVVVPPVAPAATDGFTLGTAVRPDGGTLTVDSRSLRRDGRPWIPVMGEWHYTRSPREGWREGLLQLKAGGIDIVATYVFWIHHEEVEGEWDWSGRRDLREFVRLAGEVGLQVVVRIGPWSHGEVRNGGLPDWTLHHPDRRVRTEDPGFLAHVRVLYDQIAKQLEGLRWKDGGPVVGIQLDNEYGGPAEYLLALKQIARDVGLDVPLYTRTGWPRLQTPMPFGEILPLYGAYAEGFWDRELTAMPGRYWTAFRFSTLRLDENIANEQLGRRGAQDEPGVERYPYLTCEMGGGMMSSYHRRIFLDPVDIEVPVLVKLGSGSTMPGYYMYHGGTNPEGKRTTLNEAQATAHTNWNDLPVKNYDFQAPIGAAGQLRPHYHRLRRLHLFLQDFGPTLAEMPAVLPATRPLRGPDEASTLRWSVRSDERSGFVFVNNYERGRTLPAHDRVRFTIRLPDRTIVFPSAPISVPSGAHFFWPFNLELGHGVRLAWATAQPVCHLDDGNTRTVFFAETPGISAQFAIAGEEAVQTVAPGDAVAFRRPGPDGSAVQIVVLSEADSVALWKGRWKGRDRVMRTRAGLTIDGETLRLKASNREDLHVDVFPAADSSDHPDAGLFTRLAGRDPAPVSWWTTFVESAPSGPLREIRFGGAAQPVAEQPSDADFAQAAVWTISLPSDLDLEMDPILRIRYVGDVARVLLNGKLLVDDFYHGRELDLAVRDYAPDILRGDLRIAILPLQRQAVVGSDRKIHLPDALVPVFGDVPAVAHLESVELVPRYTVDILSESAAQPSARKPSTKPGKTP